MKKINFLFAILCSFSSIAQGPPMWSNGGNNVNSGDYVGTNNNQPLIFKTNTVERSRILSSGEFHIGNGGLKINPGSYTANPIAAYMLEVGGNAYVDRSLFVKEYINSLKGLRGPKIDVDSILMDSTRGIYGKTKIFGDVQIQQNLTVNGDATFNGKVTATNGVMFDANNGFKMYPGNSTTPDIFAYGRILSSGPPPTLNPCFSIAALPINYFDGRMQVRDQANNIALTMGSDGVQSSIDHSGNNGLLINYYCGKPIYLGTGTGSGPNDIGGTAGASVFTGDNFYARKNVQIGNPGGPIDPNVSLNLFVNGTTSALKLWSNANPNVKLIHDNYDQFVVMGSGKTEITTGSMDAFTIKNSATGPINFLVKSNGFVYAREINVQTTPFPDYVFEKSYKLLTIPELDSYIKTNKHLPGFKKGVEYDKEGLNVSELLIKQQEKIEELALYIIELKKEVDALKKK